MNFKAVVISLVAVAAFAAAAPASAANLLINGDFEDTGTALLQGWGGYTYGAGYSLPLPGWTVDSGSVDIVTNLTQWSPSYEGSKALDINGFGPGSISQSFATTVGNFYSVFYAYSRNAAGAQNPALATITAPGQVIQVSAVDGSFGSPNNLLWQTSSFTFQATSALSTLTLSSTDNGSGGVFFDGLSVTAVPEPATWALMIGGFGMAGALLRRQRRMTLAA